MLPQLRPIPPRMSTAVSHLPRRRGGDAKLAVVPPRFLPLAEVAEVLGVSGSQVYALVRNGDLKGIQIGGRRQWRVEVTELENYIKRMYDETQKYIEKHPFGRDDESE
jgi:excisionase family DNA binding protein